MATANVATGSSSLTATIGGVTSRPLLMSVARTAENALVVSDAQITTAPVLVAGGAEGSALGARYTVTLQDVGQPQPGQVLLATGERPISGRVISTHPSRAGTVVTLETVPLTALYRDLDVSERVRVDAASLVPLSGPQAPEQVQRHADGSVTLTYRLPKSTKDGSPMTTQSEPLPGDADPVLPGPFAKQEFDVGPFACSSTLDVLLSGDLISIKFESKLDVDFTTNIVNHELQALTALVSGEAVGTITGGLDVDLGVQGELKCRAVFARVPVPLTGPLATVIAPTVPLGAGFQLDGKLKLGKVQFALEGKLGGKVQLGFAYDRVTSTVQPTREVTPVGGVNPVVKLLGPAEAVRLEGGLGVHATTGLDITVLPWLGAGVPALQTFDATFGPRLEGTLAPASTQAAAGDYASNYALKYVGTFGPADDLQKLLGVFGTRNQAKVFNFAPLLDVTLALLPALLSSGGHAPSRAATGGPLARRHWRLDGLAGLTELCAFHLPASTSPAAHPVGSSSSHRAKLLLLRRLPPERHVSQSAWWTVECGSSEIPRNVRWSAGGHHLPFRHHSPASVRSLREWK
ncbi:hypothetical protein [Deinococcus malanensis]|uniref:hypothetical protein n=1 Tax=Deinococcus malanensis TaxID=1706855 RepID=UPI00166A973E|nr:hypothetical protein [Deinococcus malanensis]